METAGRVADALVERVGPREAREMVWTALFQGRIDGYQAIAVLVELEE